MTMTADTPRAVRATVGAGPCATAARAAARPGPPPMAAVRFPSRAEPR